MACCCGCCDRCFPRDCITDELSDCDNPLPLTLTIDLTATPNTGSTTCFNGSGTLTFRTPVTGGLCCWDGIVSGTCTDCNGNTFNWELLVVVCCNNGEWSVSGDADAPCIGPGTKLLSPESCDPVLLSGCWDDPITACFTGCLDDVTPVPTPVYTVCFEIYETP